MEVPAASPKGTDAGWRVLTVLLAIALGVGALIVVVVMANIADTILCRDVTNAYLRAHQNGSCYSGSTLQRNSTVALGFAAAGAAAIGVGLSLLFVFTGRRGRAAATLACVAVALVVASVFVSSL